MWASVIHEKNEGKAKGHGRENQNPRQKKNIYDPFFRAHMFTFSHSLPQIKRVMIQGVTKNI
jgi:hypothetical protein